MIHLNNVFEILMLFCFGASWPFSVYKTWKTKIIAGRSLIFLVMVLIGYAAGIAHKFVNHPDWVTLLYAFNGTLVAIDLSLCLKYRKLPIPGK